MQFLNANPADPSDQQAAADIWNQACGPKLAISAHFVAYNTTPSQGLSTASTFLVVNGKKVGYAAVSASSAETAPPSGWLDALAVAPGAQKQGCGSALLNWAQEWLKGQGVKRFDLGSGMRPFTAGLPVERNQETYFARRGFQRRSSPFSWDVSSDLGSYQTPSASRVARADVRPMQPDQVKDLYQFLEREFPGRWYSETRKFLASGGRASDYTLLWIDGKVDGFCWLTFEDSRRPLDRYYHNDFPHPWGQLGPIGVSAYLRGQGFGGSVLDAGLRRLRDAGIRGCVIDWTGLLDFYGKFTFKPHRQYVMMSKSME